MELVLVLIMSALAAPVLYRVVSHPILLAMEDPPRPQPELEPRPGGRSEIQTGAQAEGSGGPQPTTMNSGCDPKAHGVASALR